MAGESVAHPFDGGEEQIAVVDLCLNVRNLEQLEDQPAADRVTNEMDFHIVRHVTADEVDL